MKNKFLLISVIIGILSFFPISEVNAVYQCTQSATSEPGDTCDKIAYKYSKDGSVKDTTFTIGIYTWETDSNSHEISIANCTGSSCNNKQIAIEDSTIVIKGSSKTPVAICGHPGNYESNYQYGLTSDNYSKYIYFSQEEVTNSACDENDIYYNVNSYPGNGDNSNNNNNSCLEQSGIRCYYKNISDANDQIEYGYTNVKEINKYMLRNNQIVHSITTDSTIENCTCPDYAVYNKSTKSYSTMSTTEYNTKKSDSNYIFFKYSDAKTIDAEEVGENGALKELKDLDVEGTYKYEGEIYCGIFGEGTWKFVQDIYGIIKMLIPALIIVLGMIDFMKVLFSGEEKDMKTAGQRFLKRIIAGVIFILLPVLLQFLMGLFDFSEDCLQQLWRISL